MKYYRVKPEYDNKIRYINRRGVSVVMNDAGTDDVTDDAVVECTVEY